MQNPVKDIFLSEGLHGQDDNLDQLTALWEQLQPCSVDAIQAPELDLISFAQSARYFAVIHRKPPVKPQPEPEPETSSFPQFTLANEGSPDIKIGCWTCTLLKRECWGKMDRGSCFTCARDQLDCLYSCPPQLKGRKQRMAFKQELLAQINAPSSIQPVPVPNINPFQNSTFSLSEGLEQNLHTPDAGTSIGSHFDVLRPQTYHLDSNLPPYNVPIDLDVDFGINPFGNGASAYPREKTSYPSQLLTASSSSENLPQEKLGLPYSSARPLPNPPIPPPYIDPEAAWIARSSNNAHPSRATMPTWDTPTWDTPSVNTPLLIGFVYLAAGSLIQIPEQSGEVNIGVILDSNHRGNGCAQQAVQLALESAFDKYHFHRIQALILDNPGKDRAQTLFTKLGFGHEGTRRRSIFSLFEGEWKSVTCLAMLDTDWTMRSYFTPAPRTLWDEMFARHQREREELMHWEDHNVGLKRTASTETLRVSSQNEGSSVCSDLESGGEEMPDAESVQGSPHSSPGRKGKGKRPSDESVEDQYLDDDSSVEDSEDQLLFGKKRRFTASPVLAPSSPTLSERSDESVPLSESSEGSESSQWDLLETSSIGSQSSFEESDIEYI